MRLTKLAIGATVAPLLLISSVASAATPVRPGSASFSSSASLDSMPDRVSGSLSGDVSSATNKRRAIGGWLIGGLIAIGVVLVMIADDDDDDLPTTPVSPA